MNTFWTHCCEHLMLLNHCSNALVYLLWDRVFRWCKILSSTEHCSSTLLWWNCLLPLLTRYKFAYYTPFFYRFHHISLLNLLSLLYIVSCIFCCTSFCAVRTFILTFTYKSPLLSQSIIWSAIKNFVMLQIKPDWDGTGRNATSGCN